MCVHFGELSSFLLFGEHSRQTHTHFTLDWILGGKGRAHWSLILGPSRNGIATYWISEGEEMAFHGMSQSNRMNFCY